MLTKESAINLLRLKICDTEYAARTGGPQPIFGLRHNSDVRLFVIDEKTHEIDEISSTVGVALGIKRNDKSGYLRVNCGYCPTTYCASALSDVLNVKSIPAKTL